MIKNYKIFRVIILTALLFLTIFPIVGALEDDGNCIIASKSKKNSGNGIFTECPDRYTVTGGGWSGVLGNENVENSFPINNGWYCDYFPDATCYAVCCDDDLIETVVIEEEGVMDAGISVECPNDYEIVGGGFEDNLDIFNNALLSDQDYNVPEGNGWYCYDDESNVSHSWCYGICAKSVTITKKLVCESMSQPQSISGKWGEAYAKCPTDSFLVGGGFRDVSLSNDDPDFSYPINNGWFYREDFDDTPAISGYAYARCCSFEDVYIVKDKDGDGYTEDVDCNDNNAEVWQLLEGYVDQDKDNYGTSGLLLVCSGEELDEGYSENNNDCNDENSEINPGAEEIPYDGIDNDCSLGDLTDADGDSYDSVLASGDDCNDENYYINPGAEEICDSLDNDCDGTVDEGCLEPEIDFFINNGYLVKGVTCESNPQVRFHTNTIGEINENKIGAKVYVDNSLIEWLDGLPFPNSGSLDWGIVFGSLEQGEHTLKIIVDSNDVYSESNEENNIFIYEFYVSEDSKCEEVDKVSNLKATRITASSIEWAWINPDNEDFDGTVIYIDDVKVAELDKDKNSYKATGLNDNTEYKITVYTKSKLGEVNEEGVSNTSKTKKDSGNNDGNDYYRYSDEEPSFLESEPSPSLIGGGTKIIVKTPDEEKDEEKPVFPLILILLIISILLLMILIVLALIIKK